MVIDRSSFSMPCLLNTLTSTTIPPLPLGIFKDVSVTSIAFSPKIDLNNFSSGPDAESPLGVTLPTNISPEFMVLIDDDLENLKSVENLIKYTKIVDKETNLKFEDFIDVLYNLS